MLALSVCEEGGRHLFWRPKQWKRRVVNMQKEKGLKHLIYVFKDWNLAIVIVVMHYEEDWELSSLRGELHLLAQKMHPFLRLVAQQVHVGKYNPNIKAHIRHEYMINVRV